MTSEDQAPATGGLTRRALRAHGRTPDSSPTPTVPFSDVTDAAPHRAFEPEDTPETEDPPVQWADEQRAATALSWLEPADVAAATLPADLNAMPTAAPVADLLDDAKLRPALLSGRWLAPTGVLAALTIAYSATMLLWPLHAVAPTVAAAEFTTSPSAAAEIAWPGIGSAGVGIAGVSATSSTADAASIASITKVVTSLMVLDRLPLQLGEQGPEFYFTYRDNIDYWDYRRANQSALDVPVDGVLTEYQLLQGTLLGSANNYVDRLARDLWGSDAQFAEAAAVWLAERGLSDITVVTPSGFDEGNIATPAALLRLGERAMQNPVFAEIVGSPGAEIPGAGYVTNTNGMLADAGVVGIKTGTLVGWCLLTAKDVTIGDTTVHLYSSVLNQENDEERLAVTRSLFAQVETALADLPPAVPAGTVVGKVSTLWGGTVDIVTAEDASVILWNGASADAAVTLDLGDERAKGEAVGHLTVDGPIDAVTGKVSLADDIADPSPWWRLTHPMELLGIDGK